MNLVKFQDTKINTYKLVSFLYTNNKVTEREIKKTVIFIITPKRKKYLGINLTTGIGDLHSESYKTLMKEIKDSTNK